MGTWWLSNQEVRCARIALKVVEAAGGYTSFDDYDVAMDKERYFSPINWIDGWGNPVRYKKNTDKFCAFAAVRAGMIRQYPHGYGINTGE